MFCKRFTLKHLPFNQLEKWIFRPFLHPQSTTFRFWPVAFGVHAPGPLDTKISRFATEVCARACGEQPVPRQDHNGEDFHYRVGYRLGNDGPMSMVIMNPNSSELVVHNVPTFRMYEIFVQSANRVGMAPLMADERKMGYSGEGCEYEQFNKCLVLRDGICRPNIQSIHWIPSKSRLQQYFNVFRKFWPLTRH